MPKPQTISGYSPQHTLDCERVLATLIRGLGPWGESVFLVGGLTPRYLVAEPAAGGPAHAGTLDVDVVIDLQILADTEAYESLEANLRRLNFERAENEQGRKVAWRWKTQTEHGATMILEFLAVCVAGGIGAAARSSTCRLISGPSGATNSRKRAIVCSASSADNRRARSTISLARELCGASGEYIAARASGATTGR